MSYYKPSLERDVERLQKAEKDLSIYLDRLEKERSDLLHSNKLIQQNLKYMTRKNSIPIVEEFEKQKKQRSLNEDRISKIDFVLQKSYKALENIKKDLARKIAELNAEKASNQPKVLEFKRKA